jgi:hypothetical protein
MEHKHAGATARRRRRIESIRHFPMDGIDQYRTPSDFRLMSPCLKLKTCTLANEAPEVQEEITLLTLSTPEHYQSTQ